ncbi:MAG: rhomboid family intramembrane serine protease [Erysipelotrichaceae bacterium]|nr:rhomboid family intramembrane serine protease [Erysipelotrichaceae bacterium]
MDCPATFILIALCVVIHILQNRQVSYAYGEDMVSKFGLVPAQVRRGQYYRILTAAFLHASWQHLLMNMIALYNLGSFLEPRMGCLRYLLVLLVAVLGSGLLVTLHEKKDSVTVGLSGAIFGLLGAYIVLLYARGYLAYDSVRYSILRTLGINLIISLMPHVSLLGHTGGLLSGLLMGALYYLL